MFFIIEQLPIFLSIDKYNNLLKCAPQEQSQSLSKLNIFSKDAKELRNKIVYDLLFNKYQEDKEKFLINWFSFDFKDSVATYNAWDLLYDYSIIYGYSYLTDNRNFQEKIISDYEGESMLLPMGRVFSFTHFVKPKKWWWKLVHKMNGRKIEIIIDTKRIKRIKGNLKEFYIKFNDTVLFLDKDVNIRL